jgi:cyclopropane fatty-acyl-phospholipid synthase-like methyltransferase
MPCATASSNKRLSLNNRNDYFFDGQYREVWRQTIPAGLTEAEVDFIREMATLQPGDAVLDLLCGYGRHALLLAREGCEVTAVDNSGPYIKEIQEAATVQNLAVHAVCAHALEWQPDRHYKAVLCMGNSFAFFPAPDTARFVATISKSLEKGGKLIINSWTIAEIALRHFRDKEWSQLEGYKYIIANSWAWGPSRIESEHSLLDNQQQVETISGVDYIYSINELAEFFTAAGLRLEAVFSTPRKRLFRMGDSVAYLVAVKL